MAAANDPLDRVLDKLIKDVEQAVHALYRGDVRQQTAKARTDSHRTAARKALQELLAGGGVAQPPAGVAAVGAVAPSRGTGTLTASPPDPFAPLAPIPAAGPLTAAEAIAITKCVMAWLPMGAPTGAAPDSRCVPAGKELIPSWSERELAREAIRRVTPKH